MARKDLAYGSRTILRILERLEEPEGLAHKYAEAVLEQAKRNAAGRPTPQSRMAAAVLDVRLATIAPSAGGPAAEVGPGSEFGSAVYPQFHASPTRKGYWLWPAGEQIARKGAEGDKALNEVLEEVISGKA